MKKTYLFLLTISMILSSCKSSKRADLGEGLFADIKTNKGDIIVKLEQEKTPVTVANFVSLAEGKNPFVSEQFKDKKYYDGVIFHRVIKDFMIQGGDPTGTGSGSPGYKFKDEIHDSLSHSKAGILSMANAGPVTNGSQFFITHKETPFLDGKHTVFGEVVEGMNVVDSIANVKTAPGDKPIDKIVMNTIEIIRIGKIAKKFDAAKVMTDYFAEEEAKIAEMAKIKMDFINELKAQKEKAETLPSGLQVVSLASGTGEKPKIGQQVLVMYSGFLEDGTLFESNSEEVAIKFGKFDPRRKQGGGYQTAPMDYSTESRLVAGFKEGLLSMKVGDKLRLFIPPHLGWGEQGGGPIPPNSGVIFDVEITGIVE